MHRRLKHPTGEALAAALRRDLDHLQAWAVLSDWLLDQADPRGERIRLGLARHHAPTPDVTAIDAKIEAIERRHHDDWRRGLPVGEDVAFEWRFGFVVAWRQYAPEWIDLASMRRHPSLWLLPRVTYCLDRCRDCDGGRCWDCPDGGSCDRCASGRCLRCNGRAQRPSTSAVGHSGRTDPPIAAQRATFHLALLYVIDDTTRAAALGQGVDPRPLAAELHRRGHPPLPQPGQCCLIEGSHHAVSGTATFLLPALPWSAYADPSAGYAVQPIVEVNLLVGLGELALVEVVAIHPWIRISDRLATLPEPAPDQPHGCHLARGADGLIEVERHDDGPITVLHQSAMSCEIWVVLRRCDDGWWLIAQFERVGDKQRYALCHRLLTSDEAIAHGLSAIPQPGSVEAE